MERLEPLRRHADEDGEDLNDVSVKDFFVSRPNDRKEFRVLGENGNVRPEQVFHPANLIVASSSAILLSNV